MLRTYSISTVLSSVRPLLARYWLSDVRRSSPLMIKSNGIDFVVAASVPSCCSNLLTRVESWLRRQLVGMR